MNKSFNITDGEGFFAERYEEGTRRKMHNDWKAALYEQQEKARTVVIPAKKLHELDRALVDAFYRAGITS